jgi:hypothetical protein
MAWLNFSVMTIWSAMTPAGGMLPTWRRDTSLGSPSVATASRAVTTEAPAQVKQPAGPCPVAGSSAGCTRALNRLSPLCFGRA